MREKLYIRILCFVLAALMIGASAYYIIYFAMLA